MATELKKTVKPSGGDYTSLEACMNANEQNLVAGDKYFNVEIDGDWTAAPDTTNVLVHNYTVDATRNIRIYAVGTAKHNGTPYKATAYVLRGAADTGTAFRTSSTAQHYLRVSDFVIDCQNQAKCAIDEYYAATDARFIRMVLCNSSHATATLLFNPDSVSIAINCILFNVTRGIRCSNGGSFAYNCTVLGGNTPTLGILYVTAINCYVGGFAAECFYLLKAGSDYCVSSDNSADDECAHYALGKSTYADYFVNVGGGTEDYHLKDTSANLWGLAGSDLSAIFTDDIDGVARTVPWDVGADEYVGGAPPAFFAYPGIFDQLRGGLSAYTGGLKT